jgi:hypothetical protein
MSAAMISGLILVAGAYAFGLVYERLAGERPAGLDGTTLFGAVTGLVVCGMLFG